MSQEPKKKKTKSLDGETTKKRKKIRKTHHSDTTNKKNQKKKTSQKEWIKYIIIVCLIVLIALGGYWFFQPKNSGTEQAVVAGDFLPDGKDAKDMSEDELKKYAQKAADDSEFNMVIAPEGAINLTDKTGKVTIQNPTSNSYPISVDLIDDQTSQVIYKSGSIQPGQEVTDIEIEPGLNLTEGDIKTTAVFSIYDPVSKVKQGEVNAEVTLKVTK